MRASTKRTELYGGSRVVHKLNAEAVNTQTFDLNDFTWELTSMDEIKRRLLAAEFELKCVEVHAKWLREQIRSEQVNSTEAFAIQRDIHAALSQAVALIVGAAKLAADASDPSVEDRRKALGALMGDKQAIALQIVDNN